MTMLSSGLKTAGSLTRQGGELDSLAHLHGSYGGETPLSPSHEAVYLQHGSGVDRYPFLCDQDS